MLVEIVVERPVQRHRHKMRMRGFDGAALLAGGSLATSSESLVRPAECSSCAKAGESAARQPTMARLFGVKSSALVGTETGAHLTFQRSARQ